MPFSRSLTIVRYTKRILYHTTGVLDLRTKRNITGHAHHVRYKKEPWTDGCFSEFEHTKEDCADVLKRYMAPRNYRLMVVRVCGNQLTHYDGGDLGPDGGHIVSSES